MKRATAWAVVTCAIAIHALQGQQPAAVIRGTLSEDGVAITQARVLLQYMDDESCARLFMQGEVAQKGAVQLQRCVHNESTVDVDTEGRYQFVPEKPGWYAVHFLWNVNKKPALPMYPLKMGNWVVEYAGRKDLTGSYDTMAQAIPLFFSGEEDVIRNFDYRASLSQAISNVARISIPGVAGTLQLDVGPTLWNSFVRPDGKETQMFAMQRPDHLLISAFLQRVNFAASPEACRAKWWPMTAKSARVRRQNLRQFEKNGVAFVDFLIPKAEGKEINDKDIHAYFGSRDLCAEVHLSKVQFVPEDQKLFDDVIATARLFPEEVAAH